MNEYLDEIERLSEIVYSRWATKGHLKHVKAVIIKRLNLLSAYPDSKQYEEIIIEYKRLVKDVNHKL